MHLKTTIYSYDQHAYNYDRMLHFERFCFVVSRALCICHTKMIPAFEWASVASLHLVRAPKHICTREAVSDFEILCQHHQVSASDGGFTGCV